MWAKVCRCGRRGGNASQQGPIRASAPIGAPCASGAPGGLLHFRHSPQPRHGGALQRMADPRPHCPLDSRKGAPGPALPRRRSAAGRYHPGQPMRAPGALWGSARLWQAFPGFQARVGCLPGRSGHGALAPQCRPFRQGMARLWLLQWREVVCGGLRGLHLPRAAQEPAWPRDSGRMKVSSASAASGRLHR